jgi:hypothetical protein
MAPFIAAAKVYMKAKQLQNQLGIKGNTREEIAKDLFKITAKRANKSKSTKSKSTKSKSTKSKSTKSKSSY